MPDATPAPHLSFSHVGLFVHDLGVMEEFYRRVLGFTVTDRGTSSRGSELAFLSRNPDEHHQIVLAEGKAPDSESTVNQMSFRVENFADVRTMYDRVKDAGIQGIAPIDLLPDWVRLIADALPFRWAVAFPVEVMLGRLTPEQIATGFTAQCAWLFASFLLLKFIWRTGVKKYSAVGS